jgi:hypothetical protein
MRKSLRLSLFALVCIITGAGCGPTTTPTLPPELQAGEYELQVGIYSPTTGQRYRLIEPEEDICLIVR